MYLNYYQDDIVIHLRNTKQLIFNDDFSISNVIFDYYNSDIDMIDYTNIVAIEINDIVISLTK